ncbi:MAG: hypothetical protein WA733_02925 [Methylocystis sp.]
MLTKRSVFLAMALTPLSVGDSDAKSLRPPQEQPKATIQPSAAEQRGTDQTPFSVKIIPTPKTQAESEADQTERNQKFALDSRLLDFTGWLVVVGALQFIAISVQAIFLWLSFKESRRVTRAAERSADAAEQALISTNRAFVHVKDFIPHPIVENGIIVGFAVIVTWENTGSTPARNARASVNYILFDAEMPDNFDYPDASKSGPPFFIAPRGIISSGVLKIRLESILSVPRAGRHLYIYGWIEYDDAFKDTPDAAQSFAMKLL